MDKLTIQLAEFNKIPWECISADWEQYGRVANHRRSEKILDLADGAVILRKGWYRFSAQVLWAAKQSGKPTQVVDIDKYDNVVDNYCFNYERAFNE